MLIRIGDRRNLFDEADDRFYNDGHADQFRADANNYRGADTVERRNVGNQLHYVTTDPAATLKKADVSNPPGAKPFDSGFLKPGESFSQTFPVPGTYRYTCAVHEVKAMNGEIIVQN